MLSRHDIVLSEALTSDPIHSELLQRVSANDALKDKILRRSTALQVLLFPCCTNRIIQKRAVGKCVWHYCYFLTFNRQID